MMKKMLCGMLALMVILCLAGMAMAEISCRLEKDDYAVFTGKTIWLKLKTEGVSRQADISWSSSDPSVASVNNHGKVETVGDGEAEITCTVSENGDVVSVTAHISSVRPVRKIEFSEKKLSLPAGISWRQTFSVLPENATYTDLDWSSSDPTIADVDPDGTIHTYTLGKCVLTAQARDAGGKKATVKLTVKKYDVVLRYPAAKKMSMKDIWNVKGYRQYWKSDNARFFATTYDKENVEFTPLSPGNDTFYLILRNRKNYNNTYKYSVFVTQEAIEGLEIDEDFAAIATRDGDLKTPAKINEEIAKMKEAEAAADAAKETEDEEEPDEDEEKSGEDEAEEEEETFFTTETDTDENEYADLLDSQKPQTTDSGSGEALS